ncbi:MAG: glycosyltransferase family 4 protein [Verrucomicrobia bacterium]|nr:glycosyltransferase family 4 protein [Verrucomicrobiota bacterium]
MHVVLISQVFYPDSQSTSQLLTELLCGIGGGLLRVTVVTGHTAEQEGRFPPRRERLGVVEIRRAGIAMNYKRSLLRRGLHYFSYMAGATVELWKLRKCSLVIGVTNPPFVPVWLWLLSKTFLGRYQIILHDVYPDGLVALGTMKPRGWMTRIWRAANRRALQSADRVVVLGRDMGELVQTVYRVPSGRIDYVPHWSVFQAAEAVPAEKTRMADKLGLQGKLVVQYSGNMGLWHDIESIVKAAAKLQGHAGIHFLMVGDGVRRAKGQQLAVQLSPRNMTWLPFQPKESLNDSLSCCHLALISQREGLKGVAVPCKLYGILASGRGVLAMVPTGSEVDLVVQEERCGRTIPPGDVDGLVACILEMEQNRSLVQEMGENAFRAYRQKYTLDLAINKFQEIWRQSVGQKEV